MSHSYDRNWYIQEKWDIFSLLWPWTLGENAGARAGIENQLKHQVEQYWVWQQPSLFEKKMAEKCIEWISRKFMCYFRRRIHSCTKIFENCLLYLKNKMKMTGSAFISDKAARCGSTFFCAIFINHRWRIIWPNLCDWPKFET